jgi:signal transduction histidine kinase
VEVAPEAAVLHVDASLVRRLLFHLLSNAFKFTTEGEVRVRIRPGEGLGSVVLAVRDTGVGIAPELIDGIFDLFAQADSSVTRRFSGLGMGLTLVQRCVRLLGGDVAVESAPQGGSEFRVHIPDALTVAVDQRAEETARTVH